MRLVTYRRAGGENRAGVVVGERIVDLAEGAAAIGETLPSDIVGLLTLEAAGLAVAGRVAEHAATNELPGVALEGADLGPVIPQPPTLLLLAGNYQSHIMEGGGQGVDKAKITPRFFVKPRTSVIGTGEAIEIPSSLEQSGLRAGDRGHHRQAGQVDPPGPGRGTCGGLRRL